MSRQQLIENYFKCKSNPRARAEMSNVGESSAKKRNLSLIKTTTPPAKTSEISDENKNVSDVVDLCSDEEDIWATPKSQVLNESQPASDSSQGTIIYSPQKTPDNQLIPIAKRITYESEISLDSDSCSTLSTTTELDRLVKLEKDTWPPQKVLKTPTKFFSPTRRKKVMNRLTPSPVKRRRLSMENMPKTVSSRILFEDDLYANACEGLDDKTKFLLDIISRCLNETSLQNLLDPESKDILLNSLLVVKPGLTLICRLYWRKEGWYKEEQVAQICCKKNETLEAETLQNMVTCLVEKKLLVQSNPQNMTFDDYTTILNREELMQICKELKLKMASKQTAIEALTAFSRRESNISMYFTGHTSSNSKRVLQMMNAKVGPCYKLSDPARSALHKLYILMYLGMDYSVIREKRLELILLYDKIQKETYPISKDMELDNASVVFSKRDEFERYLTAHNIYEDFTTKMDVSEKCAIVKQVFDIYKTLQNQETNSARYKSLPQWLHRYTPENLFVKILESGVQELKKDKDGGHNLLALDILTSLIKQDLFRQHKKADWYAEKALILHNILHRSDEAAEVLLEGFRSDLPEEAKDCMRPRAKKIASQKNISLDGRLKSQLMEYASKDTILENSLGGEHIHKQPMDRIGKRGKMKFEIHTMEARVVQECEDYCIYYYLSSGEFTHGEHWEGRIVSSLFFLLFWDIIYSPPAGVRGVFLSHYQIYPLDLFTDSFYKNRQQAIDDWLEVLETSSQDKLINILKDAWDRRPETEISGIHRTIGWDNIKSVATCLGARGVTAICRRLARDYRYSHSGFPDLTLWNIHSGRIKFVEVKTDSDKPSMKQIQWMQYLRQNNIETEFCYIGVHTTRQRSRISGAPRTPNKSQKQSPAKRKTPKMKDKKPSPAKRKSKIKDNTTPVKQENIQCEP